MTPKKFLLWGGLVLAIVAFLGFWGVIGPTAEDSFFGASWWFGNGENWAHLIIGLIAFIAGFALPTGSQRGLVIIVGIIAVLIGVYSVFRQEFLGANLENPADTILHIVIGLWALLAAKKAGLPMTTTGAGSNMGGTM